MTDIEIKADTDTYFYMDTVWTFETNMGSRIPSYTYPSTGVKTKRVPFVSTANKDIH